MLAVASMERTITFYDANRPSLDALCKIKDLDNVPMCVEYARVSDRDMLFYGDDRGAVWFRRVGTVPEGEDGGAEATPSSPGSGGGASVGAGHVARIPCAPGSPPRPALRGGLCGVRGVRGVGAW